MVFQVSPNSRKRKSFWKNRVNWNTSKINLYFWEKNYLYRYFLCGSVTCVHFLGGWYRKYLIVNPCNMGTILIVMNHSTQIL